MCKVTTFLRIQLPTRPKRTARKCFLRIFIAFYKKIATFAANSKVYCTYIQDLSQQDRLTNKNIATMNEETIGMNAGAVWNALNEAQVLGSKQLKKVTKLKDKELYAAIGWLARENKIVIAADPKDPKEFIFSLA